ncbi:TetR/AcrR family transcriptional regulator [Albirhodobacter sp. R86504]|uniref:TetR/AcrR family transcriptional regulator n=1 Tax=Albirhodobacter sp. R86504 TaxID=3093848 RepID=UPI00366BEF1C
MARQANYNRDDVLAKAQALFWAKGYHATSLKDLESALDMRPGSIYAAFGSKEALFAETLQRYGERSLALLQQFQKEAPSPLAGLAAQVRAFGCTPADPAPSRACMLVKTLLETPDNDPVLRRQTEEMMQGIEREFAAAFRAAQSAGEIAADADPERLACRLQAAIFGMRAYAQRTDSQDKIEALAEDIARDLERLAQTGARPQ